MVYPDADIFVIYDNGIMKNPYKKTDNYMITRKFLENTEKMMGYHRRFRIVFEKE